MVDSVEANCLALGFAELMGEEATERPIPMRIPCLAALIYLTLTITAASGVGPGVEAAPDLLPAPLRTALDRITPESLRGHVSFLASDLLQGRATPSKGLDIAAEYVASQFRTAGLEAVGDDGYFQTADWKYKSPDPGEFSCEVKIGGEVVRIGEDQVSASLAESLQIPPTEVVKIDTADPNALKGPYADRITGKVVLANVPHPYKVDRTDRQKTNQARVSFFLRIAALRPALVVDVDPNLGASTRLRRDVTRGRSRPSPPGPPVITIHSPRLAAAFDRMTTRASDATFSIRIGEPKDQIAKVRNVVGLLRGSDPVLKETFVLLTAHYDHLGIGPQNAADDDIFNGANDDASGTASVITIASALASLESRPKRSLVFIAFYGEEFGMVGSKYYATNPVVPLDRTVAAINLEQVGRTDDSEGPRVSAANVTGFDFSDIGATLRRAGESVGVVVSKHPRFSDRYFTASDNLSLAEVGIPSHTISVAYDFPDYHGPDDEWEKLDYANMAKVDSMTALGLLSIANNATPPKWDENNPKAKPYRTKVKN